MLPIVIEPVPTPPATHAEKPPPLSVMGISSCMTGLFSGQLVNAL